MARWTVVAVESSVPWPKQETEIEFRGQKLLLRPATPEMFASVAYRHDGTQSNDEAVLLVRQFLSSLAWAERAGVKEMGVLGGSAPFPMGRGRPFGGVVTERFRQDFLPDSTDQHTRLALSFYREALSSEPVAYRFLNFFKIINIIYERSKEQANWINRVLPQLRDAAATKRVVELQATHGNLGRYLYQSGRCAVAHSFSQPLVDPENVADGRRLFHDLPVIQALAEYAIEFELGLKSSATYWREHLYQLDGFRDLLGKTLVDDLKAKKSLALDVFPELPALTVKVRDKPQPPSLVGLTAVPIAVDEGTVWMRCEPQSKILQLLLGLDVANELLHFDPVNGIALDASDSLESLAARRDQAQLIRDLLYNGQIEILNSLDEKLLGRTDAYIGQNLDMTRTIANLDETINSLTEQIAALRATSQQ